MLRKKTFQNKVAASRYALPVTATLAALVWVAVGFLVANIWVQFAFTILSTLLMVELNNHNSLMRTYSRMVSCSFLAFITMTSRHTLLQGKHRDDVLHRLLPHHLEQLPGQAGGRMDLLCLLLRRTRLNGVHPGGIFPALPVADDDGIHQFLQLQKLLCIYRRSHHAVLVCSRLLRLYQQHQGLADHFCEFINYSELFDYSQVTDHQILNLSFVTLLTIIGSIHFIRTSYGDKIRTRMIYETFIMISVACIIFIVLQPQHIQELGGILIVNTAPLIAHFITFTRGKFTNISFILLLIMLVLIMAYNILVPESILL